MSDGWKEGYKIGFAAGYAEGFSAAKTEKNKAVKISDPGPVTPNGLSYEEIYGSVVYHQNNKKEK